MTKKFEYKNFRCDFEGRGITQEIYNLDMDGKRVKESLGEGRTLPELLSVLGSEGWELVSHSVSQDNAANGNTFHYLYFKREVE